MVVIDSINNEHIQDAIKYFQKKLHITNNQEKNLYYMLAITALKNLLNHIDDVSINLFDTEEIYTNCTVQIWSNSHTGESSVGWWRNE